VAERGGQGWQRYAAPTAFLAVATIAIVLVASALQGTTADAPPPVAPPRATTTAGTMTSAAVTTTRAGRRTYTVVAGDTFGVIAGKTGTSVAELEQLNPGVSSTSLHVGQKLRVA
jgi:Tfp pilus assembly protein FimV